MNRATKDPAHSTTWLEIDLNALELNIRSIRTHIGAEIGLIAVAKSDAYGNGLTAVATKLASLGVEVIGVADIANAVSLRHQGIKTELLVIYPPLPSDVHLAAQYQIAITVSTYDAAVNAAEVARNTGSPIHVHIQVETGMHTYGADASQTLKIATFIQNSNHLILGGISTHYSSAESDLAFTKKQHLLWINTLKNLAKHGIQPKMIHAANSAALDKFAPSWDTSAYKAIYPTAKTYVRLGCIIYGIYQPTRLPIKTNYITSALRTTVMELKNIEAGDSIGYFNQFISSKPRQIAILPIGWAANSFFPTNGHAHIRDQKVPIIGAISANACVVDVTGVDTFTGDIVTIFDNNDSHMTQIEEIAFQHNMFVSRLISNLGSTNIRQYITNN